MANFEVLVSRVNDVQNHPNADRLSLIKINDYICVSAKLENGDNRYSINDIVTGKQIGRAHV